MKNKYLSLVALATAACATSCSSDNLATESGHSSAEKETVTLEASIGNDEGTRVGMGRSDGKVKLYWHADDKISVQTKSKTDETSFTNTVFNMKEGIATGNTKAKFTGTVATGYDAGTYALYPYNQEHKFTGNDITYNLPYSYEYKTVEGNIFSKTTDDATTYPANSTCMPMLGTIADGKITFQYLGGLIVVRIDKMPATEGKIYVSADQQLSGDFTVSTSAATSTSEIVTTSTATSGNNGVTFYYFNATKDGVGVFYLPVATGNYTNLKISVGGAPNIATAEYGSLNVSRADVITIPVYQGTDGSSYSCTYEVNGHKFIDLCLPSGTLWAETNVGAATAADDGCYFAWGETDMTTKSSYDWSTYKYGTSSDNMTKYNSTDGKTVLDKEDDAAYVNWGSSCRMPTNDEFTELSNSSYCTWTWTSQTTSSGSSIGGYKVTSVKNGNSIFLPASGYRSGGDLYYHGLNGYCWSSALESSGSGGAYCLFFYSGYYARGGYNRYHGLTVRPVAEQ